MLRKIVRDLLIVFGLAALVVSTNRDIMAFLSNLRDTDTWWGSYQGRNGDLVGMSYLDVPKFRLVRDLKIVHPPHTDSSTIDLYLFGDSNTRFLRDTAFTAVHKFTYIPRNGNTYKYQLDATRKNVLIIEIAERYFREFFGDTGVLNNMQFSGSISQGMTVTTESTQTLYAGAAEGIGVKSFFNKYINQNLQYNLFNYQFITPMFATKAYINYAVFDRASGDVVISDDKNFLFLKETVLPTGCYSSYSPVTKEEVANCIKNLNRINERYLRAGFREVYLSIIPTTASIMQPKGYNQLIPIVQNDQRLKIKTIDIYSVLKQPGHIYFLPGDTHWKNDGVQEWLKMVNGTLYDINKK